MVHSSGSAVVMPGCEQSRERVIATSLWGEKGAALYGPAIEALHAFAGATGCPAGGDVVTWYARQLDRWQDACRADFAATLALAAAAPGTEKPSGFVVDHDPAPTPKGQSHDR